MTTVTMTTLSQSTFATPSSGTQAAITSRIKECITFLSRVIARQRQRRELLRLDDYFLRDIGVSRADAIAEGRKSFWKS
jgi:uncharacterized protein YjiS (DUF1127 family)